jgi:Fur family ferric uptake transcriptional regulator
MAESATPALLDEVRERLEAFLAEGGHRKTPERFAVLDEIYTKGGHFDVDT